MIQIWAIYLRSMLILKKRWKRVLAGMVISPLLYTVAFGWGLGTDVRMEEIDYFHFLLPGLIAIAGMNAGFSIGVEINIIRFINRFFEEYLLSPATSLQIVTGHVLFGITKGLVSFMIILFIGFLCGTNNLISPFIILPVLLNLFLFSSLGIFVALNIKTHRDMGSFNSFIIMPMSFLAGTFFSLKKLPYVLELFARIIPLTHASLSIRRMFLGSPADYTSLFILAGYGLLFYLLAVFSVKKTVDCR